MQMDQLRESIKSNKAYSTRDSISTIISKIRYSPYVNEEQDIKVECSSSRNSSVRNSQCKDEA
jgi:hypothetical protein